MVQSGKRRSRDGDNEGNNQKRRGGDKESSGDGDLVVYRMLCPDAVIGSVIGRGGKVINSLRQETRARIEVVDPFPGANKRVITIYCHVKRREPFFDIDGDVDDMAPLCPAQDALLRVHGTIVNALANTEDSGRNHKEEAEILLPSSQASNVIGKGGVIIKKLRSKTGANIQVNPKDPNNATHSCAMSFDNFVQITGDGEAVKEALFHVSAIMYNFPAKEEISLDTTAPEFPTNIMIPSDVPIYPANNFYPHADAIIAPHSSVPQVIGGPAHPELQGYIDNPVAWPVYPSAFPAVPGYSIPERSEELVLRVLCPSDRIGRVIGKGGSMIKNVRQTSGARVDVDDPKNKSEGCLITVTSTECTSNETSPAVEAILLLQEKINDEDDETVNISLLIPNKFVGCLIGKNGAVINDMRKRTGANVQISRGEKVKFASSNDELLEVTGKVQSVRDALVQITIRLREYVLRDHEGTEKRNAPPSDYSYASNVSIAPVLPSIASAAPLSYDQRVESGSDYLLSGRSLYGYGTLQGGDIGYGSLSSYSSKAYGGSAPSFTEMVISSESLSKVMGKGGANLANIRKLSGAEIEIVDSKSSRFEHVARITGTFDQKRAAENMIQAFIMST